MRTKVIALAIVAVLVLAASLVLAQARQGRGNLPKAGGQGDEMGAQWMRLGPRIAKELGLSQDQIQQLKQLRDQFKAATEQARTELQTKRQEMVKLWAADEPNATAIKSLAAEMDVLRAQIRDAGVDHGIAALKVLTPDQRAKLREMIKNRPRTGMGMMSGQRFRQGMGPGKGAAQRGGAGVR